MSYAPTIFEIKSTWVLGVVTAGLIIVVVAKVVVNDLITGSSVSGKNLGSQQCASSGVRSRWPAETKDKLASNVNA